MPRDDKDEKDSAGAPAAPVGRTFRGEAAPPITTPEAVAAALASTAAHAGKPGAVALHVYFVAKGITSPIQQASMAAYTDVRTAPPEVFDEIFAEHHEVPAPKPAEEIKRP